jgi:hypothetical protein
METGSEAIAANAYTLTSPETVEKLSKPLTGKSDKRGLRYFKIVKGENGEDKEEVEITRGEFKEDRRLHFTVRRGRLPRCGHKFDPTSEPRHRNCEVCWFTFFNTNGSVVQTCDEIVSKFGLKGLIQIRGKEFAKNYIKFMATLAQWKQAVEGLNVESKAA